MKRSTEDVSPPNFEKRSSSYYDRSSRPVPDTDQRSIRRPKITNHSSGNSRRRTRNRLYRNGPYNRIIDRPSPSSVGHHRVSSCYDTSPGSGGNGGGNSSGLPTTSACFANFATATLTTDPSSSQSPAASRSVYGNVARAVVQPDTNSSSSSTGGDGRSGGGATSNCNDIQVLKRKRNKFRCSSEPPCIGRLNNLSPDVTAAALAASVLAASSTARGGVNTSFNNASASAATAAAAATATTTSSSHSSHLVERENSSGSSNHNNGRGDSSTNSSSSNAHTSSPVSGSEQPPTRTRNIQSAVSAPGDGKRNSMATSSSSTSSGNSGNPVMHSEDNRPLAIRVRNLPARSSDTSLKDGLFHEYKKHGKVTWVKVVGQNSERYALVCFKKPDDVDKALEVSHDKLFFGCKIEVAPYQGYDVDDNEFRPYEAELDEYHSKSTRTLFIGNLEENIKASELRAQFDCFGEIIDIDIKTQGMNAYAFCQYSDILSVVKAMRKMDGEHLGKNRINLGFGKSMPTSCVWIAGVGENVSKNHLMEQFSRYGSVSKVIIDRLRQLALVMFDQIQYAQMAVKKMRGTTMRGRKLQVDFASRKCQEAFHKKLEKQTAGITGVIL